MDKTIPLPRYWENRVPPPEYNQPVDPYRQQPACNIDIPALSRYAKTVGKPIAALTYHEVEQFFT